MAAKPSVGTAWPSSPRHLLSLRSTATWMSTRGCRSRRWGSSCGTGCWAAVCNCGTRAWSGSLTAATDCRRRRRAQCISGSGCCPRTLIILVSSCPSDVPYLDWASRGGGLMCGVGPSPPPPHRGLVPTPLPPPPSGPPPGQPPGKTSTVLWNLLMNNSWKCLGIDRCGVDLPLSFNGAGLLRALIALSSIGSVLRSEHGEWVRGATPPRTPTPAAWKGGSRGGRSKLSVGGGGAFLNTPLHSEQFERHHSQRTIPLSHSPPMGGILGEMG